MADESSISKFSATVVVKFLRWWRLREGSRGWLRGLSQNFIATLMNLNQRVVTKKTTSDFLGNALCDNHK